MKLNIDLIADAVKTRFIILNKSIKHDELILDQVYLLADKNVFLEGKIYVVEGNKLPVKPLFKGPCAIISVGLIGENYFKSDCDYIELEEQVNISEVVNLIQETFDKYNKWNEKIQSVICESNDIQEVLSQTTPVLGNPIYLHDKDFHFIAYSEIPGMPGGMDIYDIKRNGGKFSLESLYELRDTPNFEKTFESKKATFHIDTGELGYIYYNIWVNDEYWGRLFVDERNRHFTKGDIAIVGKIGKEIERMLKKEKGYIKKVSHGFKEELKKMFDGNPIDYSMIEGVLEKLNWSHRGPYYCFKIKVEDIDIKLNSGVNISENIECLIKDSIVFPYKDNVVGIVYTENIENVSLQIENCLKAFELHIGVSLKCNDFYDLPVYYKQTEISIEYGVRECGHKRLHYFEEHTFNYMLDCCLKEFNPEVFYPPSLVKLIEYDQKKSTSYSETLKAYLDNDSSPARAMKELFVQRSTFLYRLDRINEIMGEELKNPEIKMHYLLAFRLEERWNKLNKNCGKDEETWKGKIYE